MGRIHKICDYMPYGVASKESDWRDKYPDTAGILDFKDNKKNAVDHYKTLVIDYLRQEFCSHYDISIWSVAVVPSSRKDEWSGSLLQVADEISAVLGAKNAAKALRRHQSINKLASGGARLISIHSGSIALRAVEAPANVILIDDVKSTGNSLKACSQILKDAGTESVFMLAIAETCL